MRPPPRLGVPLGILVLLHAPLRAPAQGADFVRASYTKQEHLVPMRDGCRLFTSVYSPRDTSQRWPFLIRRTPYGVGPYGPEAVRANLGPSPLFAESQFIFVDQDVRGRWMSEGQFVDVRPHRAQKNSPTDIDESTDTWDTIEWLVRNVPNHNGRAGLTGISYPGFYASAGMIDAHPALVAVSPQAPIADWFMGDDFHHNGALYLPHTFLFFAGFGQARAGPTASRPTSKVSPGTLDGYQFFLDLGPMPNVNKRHYKGEIAFWNEAMAHETYDAFWQARNLRPHLKDIRPAVLTVGGWFDAEDLFGALETYRSVEAQSPGATNTLVMGPWVHGGWSRNDGDALGDVRFDSKTSVFYRERIELPFFVHHLKGGPDPKLPEAFVFATGSNRWHELASWPPVEATARSFYLAPGGRLATEAPADADAEGFDEYVSDPRKPVPYIGGIALGMTREYMVEDQRFAGRRPDVLVYEGELLAADLTVAGPITASLHVATSGTDSDWVVKLIDVYPDDAPEPGSRPASRPTRMGGYQQLVRGEPMRGKFRNSFAKPEPFEPGQPAKVEFTLPDVFHTFRAGHRVMVQVQSSWFPLVNLNPQRFVNVNEAREEDFQKATQRVHRSRHLPSKVVLRVMEAR